MFASITDIPQRPIDPAFLRRLGRFNAGYRRAQLQGKPHIFREDQYDYRCITEWGSQGTGCTPREAYRQAKEK